MPKAGITSVTIVGVAGNGRQYADLETQLRGDCPCPSQLLDSFLRAQSPGPDPQILQGRVRSL